MFQGLRVPESPGLLAKMRILGPFSKLTEPEFPEAAVGYKFSTGPRGDPCIYGRLRTKTKGAVHGLSSPF